MAKEKALITGITGQDGSYLAEFLLEKDYEVIGLSRRTTHQISENIDHLAGRITLEHGDLIDQSCVDRLIQEHQPDEVYNLAAQSVPADSWKQPFVTAQITGVGAIRMLEAIRKFKPDARYYQATSREIYGGVKEEVINEETPFLANNPYGIAKLYAHLMTTNYRESYALFATNGILFNHESPRRGLHFVTRKVTSAAAAIYTNTQNMPLNEAGEPLVRDGKIKLGNLEAERDWGFAGEYIVAMWLMLQNKEPKDYVIGTNTSYSVQDLCEVAFDHVGLDWRDHVEVDQRFMRPTEINVQRGDYSLAQKELGWEPTIFFHQLIRMMVDADVDKLKNAR